VGKKAQNTRSKSCVMEIFDAKVAGVLVEDVHAVVLALDVLADTGGAMVRGGISH